MRPSLLKYNVTWDANILLNLLKSWSPAEFLSLKKLMLKSVTLIAMLTGQRLGPCIIFSDLIVFLGGNTVPKTYGQTPHKGPANLVVILCIFFNTIFYTLLKPRANDSNVPKGMIDGKSLYYRF